MEVCYAILYKVCFVKYKIPIPFQQTCTNLLVSHSKVVCICYAQMPKSGNGQNINSLHDEGIAKYIQTLAKAKYPERVVD